MQIPAHLPPLSGCCQDFGAEFSEGRVSVTSSTWWSVPSEVEPREAAGNVRSRLMDEHCVTRGTVCETSANVLAEHSPGWLCGDLRRLSLGADFPNDCATVRRRARPVQLSAEVRPVPLTVLGPNRWRPTPVPTA